MQNGTVKWFDPKKGYGFITTEEGRDVFVHHTGILDKSEINEGDSVEFEIVKGKKGEQAEKVNKIS